MADDTNLNINIGADPSGVEKGTRRASTSVKAVTKDAKDLDGAFRRLKSAIDPTFRATEKYNKALADNKALLAAGKIERAEYLANAKALKVALDAQVASIMKNSQAGKAAAAEARKEAAARKADARATAQTEAQASRMAAQEKIKAAREAAAAVETARKREQAAITLSARMARQAAQEARAFASRAVAPGTTRGVAPGSVDTNGRSIRQLEYDSKRASSAAANAATKAMEAAARAAESTSARTAKAAENAANRAKAAAEDASSRAILLARARASAEGQASQEAAAADKAAKDQMKRAAREAATAAAQSAKETRAANRLAAAAAREAADAITRQAAAEKQAATAAQQLRASIDPVYASQQRYNEVMRQATQLLMQNKLQQGEWIQIQKQAKTQMDVNVRSMGRMNTAYVQMGYQAQDVTASLASHIPWYIILAQQGGQTAAALSQMGGTMGKVAAFMAGPMGAAILGLVMVFGMLTRSTEEAEDATLDLYDAEKVRVASLQELRKAIDEFNKAQKQANTNSWEQAEADYAAAQAAYTRAVQIRETTVALIEQAKANIALIESTRDYANDGAGGGAAFQAQQTLQTARIESLEKQLKEAKEAEAKAQDGIAQVEIARARTRADSMTDEKKALTEKYEKEEALAIRAYEKSKRTAADTKAMNDKLLDIAQRRVKAEEQLTEQSKKTNKVLEEGVAEFRSREQAIGMAGRELQQQGLRVGENSQFGGVKGNHPGMGNQAHGKYAIDVNMPGMANEASDPGTAARFDSIARSYQARGYRVLWNGRVYEAGGDGPGKMIPKRTGSASEQHTNHMHLEAPSSIVGKPTGASNSKFDRSAEKDALDSRIEDMEYLQQQAQEDYAEQLRLQDMKIAALTSFHGEESREVIRAQRERLQIQRRGEQATLREQQDGIRARLNAMELEAQQIDALADIDLGQRTDNSRFNEQNGLVTERQAVVQRAILLDQEYADQQAHEARMYQLRAQAIRDQLALANIPVDQRRALTNQLEQLEMDYNARTTVAYRQHMRDVNALSLEVAEIQAQRWREIASTVSGSLSSAFQGMWTHSTSFMNSMIQMADQLVFKFADMGLRMLEDWIVAQFTKKAVTQATAAQETAAVAGAQTTQTGIVMANQVAQTGARSAAAATEATIIGATTAAKVTGEAIKTGAAVAGASTQTAVGAAAGMAEIGTRAATSAAGAFSSTVVIPFIGPVAAPVAAAAALAAVLGFGALVSASGGQGRVPQDGQITELHKDEMVLPAWIASPLRDSIAGMGPRSSALAGTAAAAGTAARTSSTSVGDANFYYQPQHTNGADVTLESLLRKEGSTFKRWLKNEMRNNRMSVPGN